MDTRASRYGKESNKKLSDVALTQLPLAPGVTKQRRYKQSSIIYQSHPNFRVPNNSLQLQMLPTTSR